MAKEFELVTQSISAAKEEIKNKKQISPFDFRYSSGYLINLLSRFVVKDYLARIEETNIAPAQAYVLGVLWQEEPLSQVELSRRLEIGKATMGQTLSRLENAGLIKRFRVKADRRLMMIGLTDAGQAMREPLDRAAWEQIAMLSEKFGEQELVHLTEQLIKLADIFREPDD